MVILWFGYSILTQEVCNWWSLLSGSLIVFIYFLLFFLVCYLFLSGVLLYLFILVRLSLLCQTLDISWSEEDLLGSPLQRLQSIRRVGHGRVAAHINTEESRVKTHQLILSLSPFIQSMPQSMGCCISHSGYSLFNESGNTLSEIHRGHALLIAYEFLNSIGLTFKNNPHSILFCFPLLLKIDSFLTQYIYYIYIYIILYYIYRIYIYI